MSENKKITVDELLLIIDLVDSLRRVINLTVEKYNIDTRDPERAKELICE